MVLQQKYVKNDLIFEVKMEQVHNAEEREYKKGADNCLLFSCVLVLWPCVVIQSCITNLP